jgi:Palmitoyl protein thioesterase
LAAPALLKDGLEREYVFKKSGKIKAPSLGLMLMEGRAIWELGAYVAALPMFGKLPKGDGHPVLVLPGLAATDMSTKPLRSFLKKRGYQAEGWGLGRNLGLRDGLLEKMLGRVDETYDTYGEKISLIGWSLGGIFARELAKLRPEKIRVVITLGSPHSGDRKATNAGRFYEFVAGHSVESPPIETLLHKAPPVPSTSIYSKTDGIVPWQNCHQTKPVSKTKAKFNENIQVAGSHCGLGVNPSVLYVIADRLAQKEGHWVPFVNEGARKVFFKTPGFDAVEAV